MLRKEQAEASVPTSNRFSVLGETEEEEEGEREVTITVVGDSRVRGMGREFCVGKKGRLVVCEPGARVEHVTNKLKGPLGAAQSMTQANMAAEHVVITHVGVNDVAAGKSEAVMRKYVELITTLRQRRCRGIVTRIIPRLGPSPEEGVWYSRAMGLNQRVAKLCHEHGIPFLDLWGDFYGKQDLYCWDGLHFSESGTKLLSKKYEEALNEILGN